MARDADEGRRRRDRRSFLTQAIRTVAAGWASAWSVVRSSGRHRPEGRQPGPTGRHASASDAHPSIRTRAVVPVASTATTSTATTRATDRRGTSAPPGPARAPVPTRASTVRDSALHRRLSARDLLGVTRGRASGPTQRCGPDPLRGPPRAPLRVRALGLDGTRSSRSCGPWWRARRLEACSLTRSTPFGSTSRPRPRTDPIVSLP